MLIRCGWKEDGAAEKSVPVNGGEGGNECPSGSLSLFAVVWYIDVKAVLQKEEEREGSLRRWRVF